MYNVEQTSDFKSVLKELIPTDSRYWGFHNKPCEDSDTCVNYIMYDVFNLAPKMEMYKIKHNDFLVGFFASEPFGSHKWMVGFFIHPKYREDKDNIWEVIKSNLGSVFFTALPEHNINANGFYKKKGNLLKKINYKGEENNLYIFKE